MDRVEFRKRLNAKGMSLVGWCRVKKFSPASVNTFLSGKWGTKVNTDKAGKVSSKIYDQAKSDGLI